MLYKNKIFFTGGGSSGHVAVNLALIPHFIKDGWSVEYIGSKQGIEKQLISNIEEVKFYSISTGKLRRYFDWNNITDIARVIAGVVQSYSIIRRSRPNVIFSKGGFVSLPVVIAGWLNGIPCVLHESDITPGLANKLVLPFVSKICTTFTETEKYIRFGKSQYIGSVVRESIKNGNAQLGMKYCKFTTRKPVLLIMGGSLGSESINRSIRSSLYELLNKFQIVHICGKGHLDTSINVIGYKQFEYIDKELPDVMAMADIVVSRAGSNSIYEFLQLQKPMVLVPLPQKSSRGDQILNAEFFKRSGYCEVIQDEHLGSREFLELIFIVYEKRDKYTENMKKVCMDNALINLIEVIKNVAKI